MVFLAHIDAKINTPGALDNGTGVVILLLLAELLKDYTGELGVEILAVNGEDYYGAPGQIHYLAHNQETLKDILLAVNADVAGYYQGKTEYSLYGCPEHTSQAIHQRLLPSPKLSKDSPGTRATTLCLSSKVFLPWQLLLRPSWNSLPISPIRQRTDQS